MENQEKNVYFVSGIDTDTGKSYATAYLARQWRAAGINTITQKFIQTGNVGHSEDIDLHRRIMGTGMLPEDCEGLTFPEVFTYPASPLLASRIDRRSINFAKMQAATATLASRFDRVLLEGAGGLMVPLTADLLTIDYVAQQGYPLIFVTSGKLGSVNHTLLSFEAIERRNIPLAMVAYNLFPDLPDKTIATDTEQYLRDYVARHFPAASFVTIPCLHV